MKKERVVRTTQFLYPVMIQSKDRSFCFAVCDNVILLAVYSSIHVTINKTIKPQPLKIRDYHDGSKWFNYTTWITGILNSDGAEVRGKINISKQFKIRKGTEVTQAHLEKIVAQELLSGRWDNE